MEDEKKTTEPMRPKDSRQWGTNGCPFLFFGDDEAAEYDLGKIKKFFDRKFRKKHDRKTV